MRRVFHLLLLCLVLGGCNPGSFVERHAPKDADSEARRILNLLLSGETEALHPLLDIDLRNRDAEFQLLQLVRTLPKQPPKNIDLVEFRSGSGSTDRFYAMTYQMEYPTEWIMARVSLSNKANKWLISGINIEYTPHSAVTDFDLSLTDKSILHYLFIALAVAVPCFVLVTLIVCFRTKIVKRKWLWCLAILVCFFQFKINWLSGEVTIVPLSIQVLGTSFLRPSLLSPWFVGFSLPLGAIAFMLKRRTLAGSGDEVGKSVA
jgi:hypothetical protein